METIETVASDVAFSPAVKAIQARKGSRARYRLMEDEARGGRAALAGRAEGALHDAAQGEV